MQDHPFPGRARLDGFQPVSGSCSSQEHVQLLTGNLLATVEVVEVATVGLPLRVYLSYNHQDTLVGVMGSNWRHNHMMALEFGGDPVDVVTFVSDTGRRFDFVPGSGGGWVLDEGTSSFIAGTLSESGGSWRLTFPNGTYFGFDGSGRLVSMVDRHGNATTLARDGSGLLVSVTEPTGRSVGFTYSSGLLSSIVHPRSTSAVPVVTTLVYSGQDLVQVVGPEGCVTTFSYDTATPHRLVGRTDALSHGFTFGYDGSNRLSSVTDPSSHALSYTYDTVTEYPGLYSDVSLQRTVLHDARGHDWEFRFDLGGNLWRVIDPQGHVQHYRWGGQKLVYESGPFPQTDRSRDNLNNRYRRYAYNGAGDLLYSQDGSGLVDACTYDGHRNLLSRYPAQANIAVQGNWVGQYGSEGYVLCAMDPGSPPTDRASLPSYVSGITAGTNPFTRLNVAGVRPQQGMDPRTPVSPDGLQRSLGAWGESSGAGFDFRVELTEARSFNLSLYTHSSDQGYSADERVAPLTYAEQFGREMEITVTDGAGTQAFHVYNNAPGMWVTFPVQGDAETPVHVTVTAAGVDASNQANTEVRLSVVAFDPHEDRRVRFGYNATSDLVTVTDGLGHQTALVYGNDGTLAGVTDALSRETSFFYEDTHRNLTRVVDAISPTPGEVLLTYDLHGNVLTVTNANQHAWTYEYDGKDRVVRMVDPLSHETLVEHDAVGNVVRVTDALSRETRFFHDANNRLWKMRDALGQETLLVHDAAGNLVSVTDPLQRETVFTYDELGRLVQVVRADGSVLSQAYDGHGHLVSMTGPNGHLEASEMDLVGAFNHLRNPGFEQPFSWYDENGARVERSSFAYRGSQGLVDVGGTTMGTSGQTNVPVGSGARVLLTGQAAMTGIEDHWVNVALTAYVRTLQGEVSGTATGVSLLHPGAGWVSLPPVVVDIPGDAQHDLSPVPLVRLAGGATSLETFHGDELRLLSLSTTVEHDREGRVLGVQAPDGAFRGVRRDHCGRVVQMVDPRGRVAGIRYDALDRVVRVTDPDGNAVQYSHDAVSNLVGFEDARGAVMQYGHDASDRLVSITYPDSTTELFSYDAGGNLASHTNNRGQVRTFSYDAAERLVGVTWGTGSSSATFTLDAVGRVVSMTDRNGDVTTFTYDALDRLTGETRSTAGQAPLWGFHHAYDAVGNRVSSGITQAMAEYGTARFSQTHYGEAALSWSVPSNGLDGMDRPVSCRDASQRTTGSTYDVEGNRTGLSHANGLSTTVAHDIVGRPLSLRVTRSGAGGAERLLCLDHGHDLAGNRLSTVLGNDTFDHVLDESGQLVEERVNCFVERGVEGFRQGTPSGVSLQESPAGVSLLSFDDSFAGSSLDADRWHLGTSPQEFAGLEIRQRDGLHMVFPAGYTSLIFGTQPITERYYGMRPDAIFASLANRVAVSGDFDVQVDFSGFFGATNTNGGDHVKVGLQVEDAFHEDSPLNRALISRVLTDRTVSVYQAEIVDNGTPLSPSPTAATTDGSGRFRIARSGSTLSLYHRDGSTWVLLASDASFSTGTLYVALHLEVVNAMGGVRFTNLVLDASSPQYLATGTCTSGVHDAGRPDPSDAADARTVAWDTLSWEALTPAGTTVSFQVATSAEAEPASWSFVGPDGTSGTSFTSSPAVLPAVLDGSGRNRHVRYRAVLGGNGQATPTLTGVCLSYSGTTSSRRLLYGYDGSGNMVSRAVETSTGTDREVRDDASWPSADRINALNQVLRNDVTPAGGATTSWRYAYDLDGNLVSRTDGTRTWSYSWDEDDHLVQVTLPGGATVAYAYDMAGRMLRRTHSVAGTTTFEWDGWDCVRETSPDQVVTRWGTPRGELLWFERGDARYEVHSDALGSVRMVTGTDGAVLARFDHDAWGNALPSSYDNVPGGMPYRFVGSLGVRWDADTGMHYMRHRWYDPGLGRFVSRDLLSSANRYAYANNAPFIFIDPTGLEAGYTYNPDGSMTAPSEKPGGHPWAGDTAIYIAGAGVSLVAAKFTVGAGVAYFYANPAGFAHTRDSIIEMVFGNSGPSAQPRVSCPGSGGSLYALRLRRASQRGFAYKIPIPKLSGKEKSSDVPSWLRELPGNWTPTTEETPVQFARRAMAAKYGAEWESLRGTGPGGEYSHLKKWVQRAWQNP